MNLSRISVFFMAGALLASASSLAQQQPAQPEQPEQPLQAENAHGAEKKAAEAQALGFLKAIDAGHYAEAYKYTSGLLRAKVTEPQLASAIDRGREGFGALESRQIVNATYTATLPGAPDGSYIVMQFAATFTHKKNAVETMTMSFEKGYWRVSGYFIK